MDDLRYILDRTFTQYHERCSRSNRRDASIALASLFQQRYGLPINDAAELATLITSMPPLRRLNGNEACEELQHYGVRLARSTLFNIAQKATARSRKFVYFSGYPRDWAFDHRELKQPAVARLEIDGEQYIVDGC